VCVLTSVHSPFDVRIFHKECKSLIEAGYQVILVASHEKNAVVDGVAIRAISKTKYRIWRMTGIAMRVLKQALLEHADVYHFHDPELMPVGLLLRACGRKVVYDIHEDVPQDIMDKDYLPFWLRWALSWLARRMEPMAARYFSALVPVTPHIANRFGGVNRNIFLVSNFPRLEEMPAGHGVVWAERGRSVAYVGQISANRGIAQMVAAVGLLPDSLQVRLKLAGGFSPPQLLEKTSTLSGWKHVDFVGLLDRKRMVDLLRTVRAGVVVPLPDTQFPVAYPIKMFEYMAAGIPVIASDFPLWRQIITRSGCGILVDPLDAHAIAAAIQLLVLNTSEAESMGKRGRAAVENLYNWRNEEKKLLRLYDVLLPPTDVGVLPNP
jgi:glycosyltransferase involved in cell wall biosynthesis